MWLCCPSASNPEVGPSVVSEAGEPASPKAAAAAITIIVAAVLNSKFIQTGTYNTASIGIVPNDVPIHIVINKPTKSIIAAANSLLPAIKGSIEFTRESILPVDFNTIANPAATSITNAT